MKRNKKYILVLVLFLLNLSLLNGCSNGIREELYNDMKWEFHRISTAVETGNYREYTRIMTKESERSKIIFEKWYQDDGSNLNEKELKLFLDIFEFDSAGFKYYLEKDRGNYEESKKAMQDYITLYHELDKIFSK